MTLANLIRRLFSAVGARAAAAAFGLLSQLALARAFAPSDVGIFLLTTSIMAFASLLITGGYQALGLTYLSRYQTLARTSLIAAFQAAALRTSLILTAVLAIVAAAACFIPSLADMRLAIIYGCLAAPAMALIRLNSSVANSLRRFDLSYLPDFVLRAGLILLAILAIVAFTSVPNIAWVLWAVVVSSYIAAGVQAWLLGSSGLLPRVLSVQRRNLAPFYRLRAAALLVGAFVSVAFAEIVTLIAGLLLPPAEVAVLGIAVRLAAIAGFVVQTMQIFTIPDLTDALARGTRRETDGLMRQTNLISFGLMLVALIGAVVLGEWALAIFGPEYRAGKWALLVFLASQTIRSAGAMNNHLLSLGGYQTRTALVCAVSLVTMLVVAAVLTPHWGIMGVAWASLAAECVWGVGLAVAAQRLTGRRGDLLAGLWPLERRAS